MQYFGILDKNYSKLVKTLDREKSVGKRKKNPKRTAELNNMKGDQIFNDDSSYKEAQNGRRSSLASISGSSVDNIGAAPAHLVNPRLKASKPLYTSMV